MGHPDSAASHVAPLILTEPPPHQRETFIGPETRLSECAMVGWSRFDRASLSLPPHTHSNSFEICYIVRGRVEWWAQTQVFSLGPRDIFLTRPSEAHGGVDSFMQPCELFWVQIRPRNALFERLSELRLRHFSGGPILAEHFERLLLELREDKPLASEAARAILRLLVVDTLRFHAAAEEGEQNHEKQPHESSDSAPVSPAIAAAMHAIRTRFAEPCCLRDAAQAADLRDTQFRKRFHDETGFAPHEYQTWAQVHEAKQRLIGTDSPITDIAFDLGFSSSQYFATVFRKLVGVPPQAYRRQHGSRAE